MKLRDRRSPYGILKDFLVANVWGVWIVSIFHFLASITLGLMLLNSVENYSSEMKAATKSMKSGIVMLDMLGRPIVAHPNELTPIDPSFKKSIVNYIVMYGIYDWATLTDNFTQEVRSADAAYAKIAKMKLFADNYFEEGNPQALKDFYGYITQSVFDLNKDLLPERTVIISNKVTGFNVDGGEFNINIALTVLVYIYDGNTEKYSSKEGQITVEAIGTLDPSVGNFENPLGIKFTKKFKPTVLRKN